MFLKLTADWVMFLFHWIIYSSPNFCLSVIIVILQVSTDFVSLIGCCCS